MDASQSSLFEEHKNDDDELLINDFDFEVSTSETAWAKFVGESSSTTPTKNNPKRKAFGKFVRSHSVPLHDVMTSEEIIIPPPPSFETKPTYRMLEQPPRPSKNVRSMSMFELSPGFDDDCTVSPVRCLSQNDEDVYKYFHGSANPRSTNHSSLRRCSSLQVNHTFDSPNNNTNNNNDENQWQIRNMMNETPEERDRKKIRARRHSIQGHIEPLSERITSKVRALQPKPLDLAWLTQPQVDDGQFLDASAEIISTPDRSLSSSSRKRGVCGTPIEADMSLSLTSSIIRRRSLVLIPEDSHNLPTLPIIPKDRIRNQHVESEEEEEEDDVNDDDSRNTSFHSTPDEMEKMRKQEENGADRCNEPDSILDHMTTIDDLKYLLKTLQNQSRMPISFGTNSWTVTPRSSWPQSRSSDFIQWARVQFGFACHSIDGSTSYLQIQKTHGRQLIQQLEAAFQLYETRRESLQKISEDDRMKDSPLFSRTERKTQSLFVRSSLPSPMTLNSPSVASTLPCSDTDELVAGLNQLSVQDSKLLRTVTIEPRDQQILTKLRVSLENHAPTIDLIQSLHGHTVIASTRPPRPSLGYDCCSILQPERLSVGTTHDCGTNEYFGTPMNQDVCWGSRPLPGRDWGCSEACNKEVIAKLACIVDQREADMNRESTTSSMSLSSRSSNLAFDLGACVDDVVIEETESSVRDSIDDDIGELITERNNRRRRASLIKSARMSLFLKTNEQEDNRLSNNKPIFWSKRRCTTGMMNNDLNALDHAQFPDELSPESQEDLFENHTALVNIFSFLSQKDIMTTVSTICTSWSDAATTAIVKLMRSSLDFLDDEEDTDDNSNAALSSLSLERSWEYLTGVFPWGRFLSYGAFKNVYRVYNIVTNHTEAISVMDINKIIDKKTILAELSVSAMLSSLTRRAVCPNFITIRGVFSCPHPPAPTHWGTMTKKAPLGESFVPGQKCKPPRKPKQSYSGRYVYIRMELCNEGDVEDFLKRQPEEMVDINLAQAITFQTAFALYAAADKFCVKHYDMKLLNIFLHAPETKRNLVLRYGLGSHIFSVNMPPDQAYIAKVADYGTANIRPESNGQPVTIAQFTTLENTPPDFMILGDMAKQGHAHDCFGLGLCMLHLFTGHAPYEEILEKVKCPPGFKKRLRNIWENEKNNDYKIIRSVILTDVYKDEAGNVIDGEPDETLYDTLYRFLVLFGIPDVQFEIKRCPKVWKAIHESFVLSPTQKSGKPARSAQSDKSVYRRHCNIFSVLNGTNKYIARARKSLESMNGGLELLFKLCSFDPSTRATALEVLNSPFMANLAEVEGSTYHPDDTVYSFTSFSTHR
ncbi:hypothetical protein FisN_9Lh237 [Fistulifera solaris]|uniref:Protein kinase domain-containing protein n=1 Tax=Fistulifera solaris TaxID=1519565 RepID=A0A1Z5KL77_FISSO|nr:hypothetical protein FisN_9Lh237 [Fistulifera solaris]|eukprot:GAX26937.1 hypothetical protein FisN_9Lh237 [Fistulifera solaris]